MISAALIALACCSVLRHRTMEEWDDYWVGMSMGLCLGPGLALLFC